MNSGNPNVVRRPCFMLGSLRIAEACASATLICSPVDLTRPSSDLDSNYAKPAMANPTQQQDLSLLSKVKGGLTHLTGNDWALIADKAARQQFKAGDFLVQRGRRTHGIFVLLSGTATVRISKQSDRSISPGEICGEVSFLDELPATANVVASTAIEAFYLERPLLQTLFELYPHLGSRFYHSLSAILARRLREIIGPGSEEPAPLSPIKKTLK